MEQSARVSSLEKTGHNWPEGFLLVPNDYSEAMLKARIPDAQRGYTEDQGFVALTYPESMGFVRIKTKANPKQTEY